MKMSLEKPGRLASLRVGRGKPEKKMGKEVERYRRLFGNKDAEPETLQKLQKSILRMSARRVNGHRNGTHEAVQECVKHTNSTHIRKNPVVKKVAHIRRTPRKELRGGLANTQDSLPLFTIDDRIAVATWQADRHARGLRIDAECEDILEAVNTTMGEELFVSEENWHEQRFDDWRGNRTDGVDVHREGRGF